MGKGYIRFSAAMRQTEGGDSDGITHKPSKKLKKLSSVSKIDQSTSSKRVKLPKKFFDDCYTDNQARIPRKLRSAIKQRHDDSVSPSLPNPKSGIHRLEMPLENYNKKLEVNKDERQHSINSESISEQTTKEEEEAISGLLLLAENNNTDEIKLKSETSDSEYLVKNGSAIEDLNKSTKSVDVKKDFKDFRDGIESRKICSRHVDICRMIKQMQVTEVKTVNSHEELKTETMKESFVKEATIANKMVFQVKCHGYGVDARGCLVAQDHTSFQAGTSKQVHVPPYFGSPLYDPSQWPRPPKHQMCYKNLQKSGHETMPHHLGSNNIQPSLLNVLGSKENGGLFLVDSSPTLNLTCNEHLGSDRSWLNDL